MWNKRKKTILAVAVMVCLTAGAAGTTAYFTDQEKVINTFSVGDLEIGLQESEWTPEDGDGEYMCPGECVYKNPTVKNIADSSRGGNSCYVRVRVEIQDAKGAGITDPRALELIKATIRYDRTYTGDYEFTGEGSLLPQHRIPGYFLEEFQDLPMVNPIFQLDTERTSDNVLIYNYLGADGTGVLRAGEEAVLFTNVVIPAEWTQTEMHCIGDFRLAVTAQAIQNSGFAASEDAFQVLDTEIEKAGINEKKKE